MEYPDPYPEIPSKLKGRPQWVVWRYERGIQGRGSSEAKTGDGLAKVPYSPLTGKRASTTNPSTWATYTQCVSHERIGFVFRASDPYTGIDLDECLDPDTGEIGRVASIVLEYLKTYAEVSPSGRGVKLVVRGRLPAARRRSRTLGVEMYDRGRFFTLTGERLSGACEEIRAVDLAGASVPHHPPGEILKRRPDRPSGPIVHRAAPIRSSSARHASRPTPRSSKPSGTATPSPTPRHPRRISPCAYCSPTGPKATPSRWRSYFPGAASFEKSGAPARTIARGPSAGPLRAWCHKRTLGSTGPLKRVGVSTRVELRKKLVYTGSRHDMGRPPLHSDPPSIALRRRRNIIALVTTCALLLWVATLFHLFSTGTDDSEADEQNRDHEPPPTMEILYNYDATDPEELLSNADAVFVGRVDRESGEQPLTSTIPGDSKPQTQYEVSVLDTISGDVEVDQRLTVNQIGGRSTEDGREYMVAGVVGQRSYVDSMLQHGDDYLLCVTRNPRTGFHDLTAQPQGKVSLSDASPEERQEAIRAFESAARGSGSQSTANSSQGR